MVTAREADTLGRRAGLASLPVTDEQVRAAISALLRTRQPPATICPSEAARVLAPEGWRPLMPQVRAVAVAMAGERLLDIRQRGVVVVPGMPLRGPIRLGRVGVGVGVEVEGVGHPTTPDGRYLVVRGRLWRKTNPHLPAGQREALVQQLMAARRALRRPLSDPERGSVREQIERAKQGLGERGPVWWTDGAPDFNRKLAKNTPYRDWYAALSASR